MTNKKFNLAKGGWLILLCFGIILLSPNPSQATVIPIDLNSIIFAVPDAGTGYYTQYWLDTEQFGVLDAFCVEGARVDDTYSYELVDVIPSGDLTTAAGYASRYFDGSVSALSSIHNQTEAKVATQLAIWDKMDLAHTTISVWKDRVEDIQGLDLSILDSIWLAESPANGSPGGSSGTSQDFLVSVPDASIMLLLGSSLIGLIGFGRESKK